jgi:PQQ-like domain
MRTTTSTAHVALVGGLCLAALVGCGSGSTSAKSCSTVTVVDRTTTGVLWTKTFNASQIRVEITGDDNLVALRERYQSSDEKTQLVEAASGKTRSTVDGGIGETGWHTIDIGRRLYSSASFDAPSREVWSRVSLSNDRWLTTLEPGNGTLGTFVIEDGIGHADSGAFRGSPVAADGTGVIASSNGELIEYGITFLEFGSEPGAVRWKYAPSTPIDDLPQSMLGKNYMVLPAIDDASNSIVIDRTNGKANTVEGQIVDLQERQAVVRKSGTLRRVNLETGEVEWNVENLDVLHTMRINDVLVGKARENGGIVAVKVADGAVAWRGPTSQTDPLLFRLGSTEVLALTQDLRSATLRTFDAATGSQTWKITLPVRFADVAPGTNRMVVTGNCVK